MDSNQFAQQVKQKYPQYAQVPNDQLTQAVVKKYPQYGSAISPTAGVGGAMTNPQQVQLPQTPPMAGGQGGQSQQPFNGMDQSQLLGLMGKMNPQLAQTLIAKLMEQRMGVGQKPTSPWRVVPSMLSKTGEPIQENEQTGELRLGQFPVMPTGRGNAAYSGKKSGALDPAKDAYYAARATSAETSALSTIEKQIDPSTATRTTPVGAAASTVRRVLNGLSILQMPTVTNTALQAVVGDVDSIVTQGAATVEGRKALQGSNVYAKIQQLKSELSAHPENTPVPPGIVNLYKNILQDLGPVSESFVRDRVKQQGEFYRSRGERLVGKKQYDDFINRTVNGFSLQTAGAPSMGGAADSAKPYSDPGKEARYQAWKKANGQ